MGGYPITILAGSDETLSKGMSILNVLKVKKIPSLWQRLQEYLIINNLLINLVIFGSSIGAILLLYSPLKREIERRKIEKGWRKLKEKWSKRKES